ncbi:MAG TPA: hypothetical protein VK824_00850, partial [Planctomycetota bacterium]|nr:hypothetical protein [Planctomycetota bacterium]
APAAPAAPAAPGAPGVDAVRAALDAAEAVRPASAESSLARFTFESRRVERLLDGSASDAAGARQRAGQVAEPSAQAFAALARARAADGLDPDLPAAGAQFALHRYYRLGRHDDDFATYEQLQRAALALDPLDVDGHWDLAQEAQRTRRPVLADEQLAEVFRLEPDHAYAWYVLARLAQAQGSRERSLYCYVRASEAVLDCQLKVLAGNPASSAFYQRNLERVDLAEVWKRIWDLRRELYF